MILTTLNLLTKITQQKEGCPYCDDIQLNGNIQLN